MKRIFKLLLLSMALCLSSTLFAAPSEQLKAISLDSLLICNGKVIMEDTVATLVLTDDELEGTGISLGGGTISVPMSQKWFLRNYPEGKSGSMYYYETFKIPDEMQKNSSTEEIYAYLREITRENWDYYMDSDVENILIFEDVKLSSILNFNCKITLQGYTNFSDGYFYIVCMGENILNVPFEKVSSPHESYVLKGKTEKVYFSSIFPKGIAEIGDDIEHTIQYNIIPQKHLHYVGTYTASTPFVVAGFNEYNINGDHYFFEGSLTIKTSEDYPALTSSADVYFFTSVTLESRSAAIQAPSVQTGGNTGYEIVFDEKTKYSTRVKKTENWNSQWTYYTQTHELNDLPHLSFECVFDTADYHTSYLTFLDRDGSVLKIDTVYDIRDDEYDVYIRPAVTSFFTLDDDNFLGWEYGNVLFTEKDNNSAVFDQKNSIFRAKYKTSAYAYVSRMRPAEEEWKSYTVEDSVSTIDVYWKMPLFDEETDVIVANRPDSVMVSCQIMDSPQDSMYCFLQERHQNPNSPFGSWQDCRKFAGSTDGFEVNPEFFASSSRANVIVYEYRFGICTWNQYERSGEAYNRFDTITYSEPVRIVMHYPILFEQTDDNEYYYAQNPKDSKNVEESEWILADSATPCYMVPGDTIVLRYEDNTNGKCFDDFYRTDPHKYAGWKYIALGNVIEGQAMPFGITPTYKESAQILFNDNKGDEIATIDTNCDGPIELPNAPSVEGKKFIGWGTNEDDATSVVDLTTTTPSQNTVFYAIYETSTEVSDVVADEQSARKMIDVENQQIIILHPDGRKFSVLGIEMK